MLSVINPNVTVLRHWSTRCEEPD